MPSHLLIVRRDANGVYSIISEPNASLESIQRQCIALAQPGNFETGSAALLNWNEAERYFVPLAAHLGEKAKPEVKTEAPPTTHEKKRGNKLNLFTPR